MMKGAAGRAERPTTSGAGVESVRRAIAIVQLLHSRLRPIRAREIADQLGLPLSSTYGILRELARAGWVEASGDGFVTTGRIAGFAERNSSANRPLAYLDGLIQRLRDEIEETVQLCILSGHQVVVIAAAQGRQTISVATQVGSRSPVNWLAAGRVLLTSFTDVHLAAHLADMIVPSPTGKAPTDSQTLLAQVTAARRQGHWCQIGEAADFTGAVSAPVIGPTGQCIAAISIVVPEHRIRNNLKPLIERVRATAHDASRLVEERSRPAEDTAEA